MEKLTNIGLKQTNSKELAEKLNELLANYHLYYQNLRGFHWNIKGANFFQLHDKFEALYTLALQRIDQLAERILTLGQQPLHTFTDYLQVAGIKEAKNLTSDKETVAATVENQQYVLQLERELMQLASEHGDEGTLAILSEDVQQLEKDIWMLSAFLAN